MTRWADGSIGRTEKERTAKKTPNPNWAGPFIGTHDVITARGDDTFYVMVLTTSFRMFDPTLGAPGVQTPYATGQRGWLPSPAGLRNQGLVQEGQPEALGLQSIP